MLLDNHGRTVRYLRLSVTDRCNLRCFYCRPEGSKLIPHDDVLRYEEMLELVRIAMDMGISKVRLTGGEPMVRRDFLEFLSRLMAIGPSIDLRMTTNGTLLPGKAKALKDLGLKRVNISLDTLDPAKFHEITQADLFREVRTGIDECLDAGLGVKVNAVAMKGVNDNELAAFIDLARHNPLDLRFIEFMPVGGTTKWDTDHYWSAEDIRAEAEKLADLTPLDHPDAVDGPARVFEIQGGQGRLGLISPLSNHFCDSCNRLRVTSDGRLRTCLFSDKEYKLREALRHPDLGPDAVRAILERASQRKPLGYRILEAKKHTEVCQKQMSTIGG